MGPIAVLRSLAEVARLPGPAALPDRLAAAEEHLGPADFRGVWGDDGFPAEEAEAVEAARWHLGAGSAGINLMHEDQGVPFRLTVTAT
ncbi:MULTISPECIES: hypothetical protein [Catenuloplanes]|uniref:Uncharacterized protein n=1 Tax=Catenuloplanes niger TaxID=587534 RepID=A0AAE4CYQ0_9ACTN|nr:hypothetical protein [Catenuloplanes niger]MDR7327838.1 hypothetical protein [Catenuloplanes niger]